MKKAFCSAMFLVVFGIGTLYGILIYKFEIFPYNTLQRAYHAMSHNTGSNYGPWSIGIFEGTEPFTLSNAEDFDNPVLTAKDVSDIDALFVADPFMKKINDKYYLFFEALNRTTGHGDIAYAESTDGIHWSYQEVIIDEDFHLSYPYVFESENTFYLIPESFPDLSVRLYKAVSFPDEWEYVGTLLAGYPFCDPSIFRFDEKWWMFVSTTSNSVLNLYFSQDLLGEWKPHPMNPIIKSDKHIARPAGKVINYKGRPYRMAQDDFPEYGTQVFAFKILELTEKSYIEEIVSRKPLVRPSGKGWNAAGMHHVDLHQMKGKWIAYVDGRVR